MAVTWFNGIQTFQSTLVHIYYFLSNYFCFDYFIQGIPDLPAEPEEHGEQPQQQEEGGEEAPASGGLFTNIVTSVSSIDNQHIKKTFLGLLSFDINPLAFYHECCFSIGYATRCLFCFR